MARIGIGGHGGNRGRRGRKIGFRQQNARLRPQKYKQGIEPQPNRIKNMLEHILNGGPLMVPLMACSLISLAVVYDRWMAFRANRKIDTRALRSSVMADLRNNDISGAIRKCESARGPIASVLLAGLRSYKQLKERDESTETMRMVVAQVMEDYEAQAMGVVNKRLDVLTTVGTAAPLLGMTGTVTGMIETFRLINVFGTGDAKSLASGISEALVTTEFGLIVAIPALILHALLSRKVQGIKSTMEMTSLAFLNGIESSNDLTPEKA